MPAEGLAFFISAIRDILLLIMLFSIFSLKLIKFLFSLIFFLNIQLKFSFLTQLIFFFFNDYFT